MNNLSFCEPVWLASDIHLGPDNPRTSETFYRFLAHARNRAGALILLGDIFDVWIGDDWIRHPPPWLELALHHLRETGQTLPMWILGGNRDFLIGDKLAHHLDARLIRDQCLLRITSHGKDKPSKHTVIQPDRKFLLAHGDEFCTEDLKYQRFRRIVRNPALQSCFMLLPLSLRKQIARRARQTSQQTDRSPHDASYDVQDTALAMALQNSGAHCCIHGHTHRPGHFPVHTAQSGDLSRWVLPDWECDHHCGREPERGGWMEIDQSGLVLRGLIDLPARI